MNNLGQAEDRESCEKSQLVHLCGVGGGETREPVRHLGHPQEVSELDYLIILFHLSEDVCERCRACLRNRGDKRHEVRTPQVASPNPRQQTVPIGEKWVLRSHRDCATRTRPDFIEDRKSTRLNSSHLGISYAV